ncbi:MAG: WYL domain-containing protein [Lachnospiraceae bacterium]|nr:WYL domain-containing protein [Lachnospiraceae bacterium]
MAKTSGQKTKIIHILNFLRKYTDENHTLTTTQIQEKLSELGITADRKTLYSDISCLTEMGYNIVQEPTRTGGGWKLVNRDFELAELKLLVDAVQSSRFITTKKSRELIKKLGSLVSDYDSSKLNRQVYVASRIKSENESIFYIVDSIHRAIQENKQISFTYLSWNISKELVPKGKEKRIVSPWALIWNDENYYLVAFDAEAEVFKHFRVDKMSKVNVLNDKRLGQKAFSKYDIGSYADSTFGMMGGKSENIVLDFPESLVGVVIDRFGKDVSLSFGEDSRLRLRTKVVVSGQFFGWLSGLGTDCVIHSPAKVREDYIRWLKELVKKNESIKDQ